MIFRYVLLLVSIALGVSSVLAVDEQGPQTTDAVWISFMDAPIVSQKRPEFHARATGNTDPKLLRMISAHVSHATDRLFLLKSYSDADLKYRTEKFIVTKIQGTDVTLASGKTFPQEVTHGLARQLRRMGFRVTLLEPRLLLVETSSDDSTEPFFALPYAKAESE